MRILVLDRYPEEALGPLRKFQVVQSASPDLPSTELQSVEALLIRSRTQVGIELLRKTPHLKVVVTATSGFNHIDLEECNKRGIKVFYTPEANARSAAELTLFLILGCLRKFPRVNAVNNQKLWKDQLSAGNELAGKSVGLVGFGRVGRKVANLLKAFEASVQFYDPYVGADAAEDFEVTKVDLTHLLKTSDIVSLHVPLTKVTRNLMHANNLAELSSEAYLINTSRGEVVAENALIQALATNHLAGAGLDVFEREPLSADSKLRTLPNVLITPHIGALTDEALKRASEAAVQKLVKFLETNDSEDALPSGIPWL